MKIAPIVDALRQAPETQTTLVHTGQHYDKRMSKLFFEELQIPEPDVNLQVGSGTHAEQTAEVMKRFEPVCLEVRPDWVIVVGDVNSTIACSLVAVKLGIKVAHVEAGLRSFDRAMPEEINRVLTDSISDMLFVTEPSALENLRNEGVDDARVRFVGNVMIDTLLRSRERANQQVGFSNEAEILRSLAGRSSLQAAKERAYAVLTLHRPSNVDCAETFGSILDAIDEIGRDMPVIFPIHPRSRKNIETLGLAQRIETVHNLHLVDPLGYLDFLKLTAGAAIVLTDSGGIQEETTILGVPCLTLRENTERPITTTVGTNRLTGSATKSILAAYKDVRENPATSAQIPELWDGHAAQRIVECLMEQPVGARC
jgi:UDP-N-acetylglucosamine 2-epimerase (non-hydrolysing)